MGKKRKDRSPQTAYNVAGESSSTSNTLNSSPECKYDVFLSFAGEDTRLNFTGHLYEALKTSGIRCFRDDVDLPKGKNINYLFQAIQDSLCAVLIISKNYAKSKWCLDELKKILQTHNTLGRRVFPIFYNVDPADVREQRGRFGKAFSDLEKKFKDKKIEKWRTALSTIGSLSGWPTKKKHEADLIRNIVGDVWSFLSTKLPCFKDNLVGIDSKVADVIPFLKIGLDDNRFVGIWGMGGVGKTTLARVVFEKLSDKFEIRCFLFKVKDVLPKDPEGLVSLQKSLLSHLKIKGLKIHDRYEGRQMIARLFRKIKVLLVIDDIDDMSQLDYLAESPYWFGKGSRIIITTRNKHVLTSFGGEGIYEMKTMKHDESLQIFSKEAFNKNHPEEIYLKYSKSVVKYAGGLPLALQALGSYFRGRSGEVVWRDALEKLKQINPHKDVLKVLKISYDGLDELEQTIFLDIVCLFKRWRKEEVTQILKGCDLKPTHGIEVLIEKTLLVETKGGILDMHDLYEDLGWNIIQQKFPNSRLGKFEEIKEVLENNKGSGKIEAIVMDKYWDGDKIEVHPEAFSKMSRLRLLLLNSPPNVPTRLKELSSALKFVRWPSFPLEALPLPLDELVHIELPKSNIKQLWNGKKSMNHLKFIDLSGSSNFTETPDFSNVQSLGHLCLSGCESLVKVHESLGSLKELVEVDLHDCLHLNSLPSKLETNSLRKLDLHWCVDVKNLPQFGNGMKKLSYLDAGYTGITSLPESLRSLTGLRWLNLGGTDLKQLPTDCFSSLFGLFFLSLDGCFSLKSLPRLPPRLSRLEADCCISKKRSFDEHMMNNLMTSLDHECRGQTKYVISDEEENIHFSLKDFYLKDLEPGYLPLRDFFATMPTGHKIPSWFHPNIKYYDEARYECEIEVDVPSNFHARKWSGIVVCLRLEGIKGMISWSSKSPEDDKYNICGELAQWISGLRRRDGRCVMVLEFNQETCWQHLSGDNNSLHIQLFIDHRRPRYGCSLGILGCGWRLICEEEKQKKCHPNHSPPFEVKLPLGVLPSVLPIW